MEVPDRDVYYLIRDIVLVIWTFIIMSVDTTNPETTPRIMAQIPKNVTKFKGDHDQSFTLWIQMVEAQMAVLGTRDDKKRDTLLCLLESSAFVNATSAIAANNALTYDGLKDFLREKYCGQDYKRSLEQKFRNLRFKPGSAINNFISEISCLITDLYGITDTTAVDLIAQNHVLPSLESSVQEQAKVLQLTNSCSLQSLLELANAHAASHPIQGSNIPSAASGNKYDRVSQLEKKIDMLTNKMDGMMNNKGGNQKPKNDAICEVCNNIGHTKTQCFKLKECFKCKKLGHIAKYCRSKKSPNSCAGKTDRQSSKDDPILLPPAARIMMNVMISGKDVEFLYDPGSTYTMITSATYDLLPVKPPLIPVEKSGVGISEETFKIDGVAFTNLTFLRDNGTKFILEYQPILVSSEISSNIFGVHSEQQFRGCNRNHEDNSITFLPYNGADVKIKYWQEQMDSNSAYVKVAKVAVIPDGEVRFVTGRIEGSAFKKLNQPPYLFDPNENIDDVEIGDVCFQDLKKRVKIPILNTTGGSINLNPGEILGSMRRITAIQAQCASTDVTENPQVDLNHLNEKDTAPPPNDHHGA